MEPQHVANISALIHFMDGLNDPKFDMSRFAHDCDTPACALGWACTIPALRKRGLCDVRGIYNPKANDVLGMADRVFGTAAYGNLFSGGNVAEHCITTPKKWVAHARKWLRSEGHEVLPQTEKQADDFSKFMECVLKPVAVTA